MYSVSTTVGMYIMYMYTVGLAYKCPSPACEYGDVLHIYIVYMIVHVHVHVHGKSCA